jgi:hypothetical protein
LIVTIHKYAISISSTDQMPDLRNQYRILYLLYEALNENKLITNSVLRTKLHSMDAIGKLNPELVHLEKNDYIDKQNGNLQLTAKGLKTTILLFRKFIKFIRKFHAEDLSYWIKSFDYHKWDDWDLISNIYFNIERQPELKKAFTNYLDDLESIEQVDSFEINIYNPNELIDIIFLNMDEINNLFENKFGCKLFCPTLAAQSMLHKATSRQVNFPDLVAIVGTIIDSICHKEIDALLTSKDITGSINKIKILLDEKSIHYDPNTISALRTLHHIRSTTFPIHKAGPDIIPHLQKLNISFTIDNYKDAASKILNSLNSCLVDMKAWFK